MRAFERRNFLATITYFEDCTMNIFYANCKHENWDACNKYHIFGVRGRQAPNIELGDILLLRLTGHSGLPYGVKALWLVERLEPVSKTTFVPWTDSQYSLVLHCKSLIVFSSLFSEDFATSSKVSQKLNGLFATRLMGSIGELKPAEAKTYFQNLLAELGTEIEQYPETLDLIKNYLSESSIVEEDPLPKPKTDGFQVQEMEHSIKQEAELLGTTIGIVGERIDLPILNYAPLNEMGVVILFGYYMKDLGFSHLEEIRSGFPDAIGMQSIDGKKYKRIRIEFEYRSKNFQLHNHPVNGCDVIVCWEHDWTNCPLKVIELRTILFPED